MEAQAWEPFHIGTLAKIPSADNLSDIFTKGLGATKFAQFSYALGIVRAQLRWHSSVPRSAKRNPARIDFSSRETAAIAVGFASPPDMLWPPGGGHGAEAEADVSASASER